MTPTPTLRVELAGSMFTEQTMPASELIGILAAVIILLMAFGRCSRWVCRS